MNRFGKESKFMSGSKTLGNFPGPGQYQPPSKFGAGGPRFSIGKEMRGTDHRPQTPGPGQYTVGLKTLPHAPMYTISSVRPSTAKNMSHVPGPGQYTSTMNDRPKSPSYRY